MTELEVLARNINGLTELLGLHGEILQTRYSLRLSAAKRATKSTSTASYYGAISS